MRNKLNLIIVSLMFASVCLSAQEAVPAKNQLALTIILDTSSSCDRHRPDFVSLSRQAISSCLSPGDYIEVISAHSGKPKIRIAQTIKSGNPEEIRSITAILKTLRCGFLSNASISKALEMAITRLNKICSQNDYRRCAVIIFGDGQLSDSDAQNVVELSKHLQKGDQSLYVTGTTKTSKRLLVAANQGKLQWSLISEANPVIWLRPRGASALTAERLTTSKPSEGDETAGPNEPKAAPSVQESERHAVESRQIKTAEGPEYEVRTSLDSRVSFSRFDEKPGGIGGVALEDVPKETEQRSSSDAEQPEGQTKEKAPPFWQRAWRQLHGFTRRTFWWLLVPLLVLLLVLGIVFAAGFKEARRWQSMITSRLKKNRSSDSGVLIAKLNGQTYRLGKLDTFRAVNVGKGINNTIRIDDKSLSDRHLQVFKRGNALMVRNLSQSPIAVNGTQVKRRGKHPLVLPSVVELSDRTKLNLELVKPKTDAKQNRSAQNEQAKQ